MFAKKKRNPAKNIFGTTEESFVTVVVHSGEGHTRNPEILISFARRPKIASSQSRLVAGARNAATTAA